MQSEVSYELNTRLLSTVGGESRWQGLVTTNNISTIKQSKVNVCKLIAQLALQCVLLTFNLGILTSIKGIQTLLHRHADVRSPSLRLFSGDFRLGQGAN